MPRELEARRDPPAGRWSGGACPALPLRGTGSALTPGAASATAIPAAGAATWSLARKGSGLHAGLRPGLRSGLRGLRGERPTGGPGTLPEAARAPAQGAISAGGPEQGLGRVRGGRPPGRRPGRRGPSPAPHLGPAPRRLRATRARAGGSRGPEPPLGPRSPRGQLRTPRPAAPAPPAAAPSPAGSPAPRPARPPSGPAPRPARRVPRRQRRRRGPGAEGPGRRRRGRAGGRGARARGGAGPAAPSPDLPAAAGRRRPRSGSRARWLGIMGMARPSSGGGARPGRTPARRARAHLPAALRRSRGRRRAPPPRPPSREAARAWGDAPPLPGLCRPGRGAGGRGGESSARRPAPSPAPGAEDHCRRDPRLPGAAGARRGSGRVGRQCPASEAPRGKLGPPGAQGRAASSWMV